MKFKLTTLLCIIAFSVSAQQYMTRQGSLAFDAGSPLEDIYAVSKSATVVYDAADNKLGVQVLMTSFEFKRALMQEHFNENYVESEVYPKAVFKGVYKDGRAIGALSIHGVTKDVNVPAKVEMSEKSVLLNAQFSVKIEEFGVAIPKTVANKIDSEAKITVNCEMLAR